MPSVLVFLISPVSIGIIFLFSLYLLIQYRQHVRSAAISNRYSLKYNIQPSFNLIPQNVNSVVNDRASLSNWKNDTSFNDQTKATHSSILIDQPKEMLTVSSSSFSSNYSSLMAKTRRQSSIIDYKRMAQIEFALPPTKETSWRRSIAGCSNIFEDNLNVIHSIIQTIKSSTEFLPCLLTFSLLYTAQSHFILRFHSLSSLKAKFHFEKLIFKVKLLTDGKTRYLGMATMTNADNLLQFDYNYDSVEFKHILPSKLKEKIIVIKIVGKLPSKKMFSIGRIGKIRLGELKELKVDRPMRFVHEVEEIKMVS
jgi:hypothetical protein